MDPNFIPLLILFAVLGFVMLAALVAPFIVMARRRRKQDRERQEAGLPPGPVPTLTPKNSQRVSNKQLEAMSPADAYARMLREQRSSGLILIFLGMLHLVISGLNTHYGVLLIVVGLMSFFFRDASMFVIYSITLAWAGVFNLLTGVGGWAFFALLQFYWAYTTFRRFLIFRNVEAVYVAPAPVPAEPPVMESELSGEAEVTNVLMGLARQEAAQAHPLERGYVPDVFAPTPAVPASAGRSAKVFPWLTTVIGVLAVFSTVGIIITIFGMAIARQHTPAIVNMLADAALGLSLFGFAVGLAASLMKYKPTVASIFGTVISAVSLLIWIGMIVFSRFT